MIFLFEIVQKQRRSNREVWGCNTPGKIRSLNQDVLEGYAMLVQLLKRRIVKEALTVFRRILE